MKPLSKLIHEEVLALAVSTNYAVGPTSPLQSVSDMLHYLRNNLWYVVAYRIDLIFDDF